MLIGQDWGNVNFYDSNGGKDPDDSNLTNEALNKLFSSNGYETGTPGNPSKTSPVYFTNAVIGLKREEMPLLLKQNGIHIKEMNF